ncbi:ABC transporter ATP-binding protein [Sporosarcina sp. JAI121]|uniref:ABC transporter ATP-binding protein n=1 Tax=Sporosarcina sp. JAI121 TaxID=2723064 RepID=UPI0015CDE548|nr:ABC transporter ATP-binding protein [Sporosarcina sp. JAI121]NYF25416.1 iron complex transport system ATP-binding protein [Sporosarcina sp. JAI121]
MKEIVSFRDVMLRRGDREILHGINWSIQKNEHWGILGLNGSGKTSLLNIMSGFHFPSSGEVSVLGNLFGKTNLPKLRKEIGFVSSSLDRFAEYFNKEKIERVVVSGKFASFGIYEQVEKEDWKKAHLLLESLHLSYLIGKPYQLLSEGEKRRVLIARALMSDPKMLVLDEPCSGLDILSREQFLQSLNDVMGNGCHIVYVTHHIEELVPGISHVLLLKEGKVVAGGPKEEVVSDNLLSETYRIAVKVQWRGARPWLVVNRSEALK